MSIKLHHLRPAPGAHTDKTRVGRGEGSKGKTAGRGTKGTKARKNVPAGFEGGQMPIQMRLPKLKGFKNRNKVVFQVVNVSDIQRLFTEGGQVGVSELVAVGAVSFAYLPVWASVVGIVLLLVVATVLTRRPWGRETASSPAVSSPKHTL